MKTACSGKVTFLTISWNVLFRKSRDKSVRSMDMPPRPHTHRARACYQIFNMRFIRRLREIISSPLTKFPNILSIKFTLFNKT